MGARVAKDAVTVRLDEQKRGELDALAGLMARDRSFLINEAIESYLSVHRWQIGHVTEGLRQANAGEFASAEDVEAAYTRWV